MRLGKAELQQLAIQRGALIARLNVLTEFIAGVDRDYEATMRRSATGSVSESEWVALEQRLVEAVAASDEFVSLYAQSLQLEELMNEGLNYWQLGRNGGIIAQKMRARDIDKRSKMAAQQASGFQQASRTQLAEVRQRMHQAGSS